MSNKYGKFLLFNEADDDNEPDELPKNRKVIDINPNKRGTDFTDNSDDDDESINENDTTVDEEDYTADADNEDTEDNESSDQTDTNDTDNDNTDNETATEYDNTEITADETNDEDEDFTSDVDNSDDDTSDDTTTDTDNDKSNDNPGVEYDNTRKYILFEKYEDLMISIENMITKLEKSFNDNISINKVVITCKEKLVEIYDILYDYLLLRFQLNTYLESMVFYQKSVVVVSNIIDLLHETKYKFTKDKYKKIIKNTKKSIK